jgi:hypothetical protein
MSCMKSVVLSFLLEVTSLYSASLVSIHHSYGTYQLHFLYSSHFVSHSLLKLLFTASIHSCLPDSSISSDVQHFLNPLTITSGEICCHGLDSLISGFTLGFFIVLWCQNMSIAVFK